MRILLTPDQESTLWHLTETMVVPNGDRYYFFPYFMRPMGNGMYERLTFEQLPEKAKDMVLQQKGIKTSSSETY
jgi:hypothetical protein